MILLFEAIATILLFLLFLAFLLLIVSVGLGGALGYYIGVFVAPAYANICGVIGGIVGFIIYVKYLKS